MEQLIKCSKKDCKSHELGPAADFTITLTVESDLRLETDFRDIEPEYYVCSMCGSNAVSVEARQ